MPRNYDKVIYLSHGFGGLKENLDDITNKLQRFVETFPNYLFVSPVNMYESLYDITDYDQGLDMCLYLLGSVANEMWVCDINYKESKGCNAEIKYCEEHKIPVKYFITPTQYATKIYNENGGIAIYNNIKLDHGDCLELMSDIEDESIDMILCDLPYGSTKNKWDSQIDLEKLWKQYKRIIKRRGCIALFAQTPFDKVLGTSNLDMLKYEWIWDKPMATGRLNCNYAPMKAHENILIFSKSAACYVKDKNNAMIYNPQMTEGKPYTAISGRASTNYDTKWSKEQLTVNSGTRYPRDIQRFSHDKEKYHPTQKPVALLEYLIKTYTNKGDLVLDNCMGSGSTGVACINTGRRFIGIELDDTYYDISKERINKAIEKAPYNIVKYI